MPNFATAPPDQHALCHHAHRWTQLEPELQARPLLTERNLIWLRRPSVESFSMLRPSSKALNYKLFLFYLHP